MKIDKILNGIITILLNMIVTLAIYKNVSYEFAVMYLLLLNWASVYGLRFELKEKYK